MTDYFVDFSAGSHGTGTFASPYNSVSDLVSHTACTSSDSVWIRRNTSGTIPAIQTFAGNLIQANKIVGWPNSSDPYYSVRPVVAQAAWDADAVTKPLVIKSAITSTSQGILNIVSNATTKGAEFANIRFEIECSSTSNYGSFIFVASAVLRNFVGRNCEFVANVTVVNSYGAILQSDLGANNYQTQVKLYDCTYHVKNAGGTISTQFDNSIQRSLNAASGPKGATLFKGCTFKFDYGMNVSYSGGDTSTRCLKGVFKDCLFEWTTHRTNTWQYIGVPNDVNAPPLHLINCHFKGVYAGTVDQNIIGFEQVDSQRDSTRCSFRNIRVTGFNEVYVQRHGAVHFKEISADVVHLNGSGVVSIDNINAVTLNVSKTGLDSVKATNTVIIKNYNSGLVINRGKLATLFMSGNNNDPTTWAKQDEFGTVNTAAPYRTGGEAFSVKMLASTAYGETNAPLYSNIPGLETIYASCGIGARTLTIFGYYKAFSAQTPDTENTFIEVDYRGSSSSAEVSSRADYAATALTGDASTWNGISGGTPFKIVVNFTTTADCAAAIRLCTTLSEAPGELYFDPKPIVT